MCSQTRNNYAKAFDNRSRSKDLKPKTRGGRVKSPAPLKASRVLRHISDPYNNTDLTFEEKITSDPTQIFQ